MDYKNHTQQRYLERFKKQLSDEDYFEICRNLQKFRNIYISIVKVKVKKKATKHLNQDICFVLFQIKRKL